jgi:hypothetical protein
MIVNVIVDGTVNADILERTQSWPLLAEDDLSISRAFILITSIRSK